MKQDNKYTEIMKQLNYKPIGSVLLRLCGVISRYLCDKNLHRWKVRHGLMFNAPIDRTCKCCNKKQRMNIHLKYVDFNGL